MVDITPAVDVVPETALPFNHGVLFSGQDHVGGIHNGRRIPQCEKIWFGFCCLGRYGVVRPNSEPGGTFGDGGSLEWSMRTKVVLPGFFYMRCRRLDAVHLYWWRRVFGQCWGSVLGVLGDCCHECLKITKALLYFLSYQCGEKRTPKNLYIYKNMNSRYFFWAWMFCRRLFSGSRRTGFRFCFVAAGGSPCGSPNWMASVCSMLD